MVLEIFSQLDFTLAFKEEAVEVIRGDTCL